MLKINTIIEIDNHTVVYGSSTNMKLYPVVMKDRKIDLLLTDPPYNVAYSGTTNKKRKRLLNDNLKNEYEQFVINFLRLSYIYLKPGAPYYIFAAGKELGTYHKVLEQLDMYQSVSLVWIKNHFVLSFADYKAKHEHILYGWKRGEKHKWYGANNCSTALNFAKPYRSTYHPTTKPRALIRELLLNSSQPGDIVFDPFGGSGTTLLECEKHDRTCIMFELELEYIQTIINRYKFHYPEAIIKYTAVDI